MSIIKFLSKKNKPAFLNDIEANGYHIYNLNNAKTPGYYPPELPEYPGIKIKDLRLDDVITLRVFFGIGKGKNMRIDGGYIDVRIEHIDDNEILAVIMTKLPQEFSLKTGSSIEIFEEEMLYKAKAMGH